MSDFFDAIRKWVEYDAERDFYAKHNPSLAENADLVFRPMRKADLKAVIEIEASAYEFPWEPATFRDCLKVGYCCWVGEKAGRVRAYGILTVGAGESHILNVCIAPEVQGQGYGRLLMEKLMAVAKAHRAEMMLLEVRPSNSKAMKLYFDLGFNQIGTRKGYYPARNGREDALVLARML
ncbi:MAG TPA: ribosomal protein S18-alanine N-acetyltransferase [Methylococcaceae bacterium]|jgi:ribosomal-protein-alanine N-acetyltransferase|nr:ribosomal protein S18-alanine N-acetyltransferase [Methylococcaceae bacterium]